MCALICVVDASSRHGVWPGADHRGPKLSRREESSILIHEIRTQLTYAKYWITNIIMALPITPLTEDTHHSNAATTSIPTIAKDDTYTVPEA